MLLTARTATVLFALTTGPALACPGDAILDKPGYAEINISLGNVIDPFKLTMNAGGLRALRDCSLGGEDLEGYDGDGWVYLQPDVVLNWYGGGPRFAVTVAFDEPTLLLILDPQGNWHFDAGEADQAPLIAFENPRIGAYVIWNGVHGEPHAAATGELIISQSAF